MIVNIGDYKGAELVMNYEQWEEEYRRRTRRKRTQSAKIYAILGIYVLLQFAAIIQWLCTGY
jgi:hypothetical protein